jgi:hypothetical protein
MLLQLMIILTAGTENYRRLLEAMNEWLRLPEK